MIFSASGIFRPAKRGLQETQTLTHCVAPRRTCPMARTRAHDLCRTPAHMPAPGQHTRLPAPAAHMPGTPAHGLRPTGGYFFNNILLMVFLAPWLIICLSQMDSDSAGSKCKLQPQMVAPDQLRGLLPAGVMRIAQAHANTITSVNCERMQRGYGTLAECSLKGYCPTLHL